MDKITESVALFDSGFNCAQAVLAPRAEELGLPRQAALKLAAGFGGGIGQTGRVCGALSGACMLVGLKYGRTDGADKALKLKNYEQARVVIDKFRARAGHVDCKDLLGFDMLTPEGQAACKQPGAFDRCPEFVRIAAEIAAEELDG